jgi:glyoxylase-like metal-dependent hydrolase (beta-lactamase superfamily II)
MNIKSMRYSFALLSALVAAALPAVAQNAPDYSKVEIKTTRLADNFYTLEGSGGTIGILVGPDGVLMVDGEFAPLSDKILAAIRKVSDKPIRFLINTHVHGDHTGGNENFAKAGATIFARDELRNRLIYPSPAANGTVPPSAPPAALPLVTYEGSVTFHMNGEEARLIPIPHAHTDGDTMILFTKDDIILCGDFFRSIQYPNIDRTNGGTLQGMLDGLGVVAGLAGPNTKIVPGHGPVVGRAEVIAQHDMILAIRDRIAPLVAQGKSLDEVIAANPTSDYDAHIPNAKETSTRFVTQLYQELKAAK